MARARNIKPGFFKNFDLADCGPMAQLLFAGLWTLADKEGRLKDQPRFIKAEIFPYYPADVNGELTKLERLGFIRRYREMEHAVIEVLQFKEHQSPHHTEKDSKLPAYNANTSVSDCNKTERENNESLTVNSPTQDGGNPSDSLIPDSLIPDSLTNGHAPKPRVASRFLEFWEKYPLKKNRKDAEDAWRSRRMDHKPEFIAKILDDLSDRATKDPKWVEGFIPHGSTYIRKQRWEDAW